jgi:hypothetical protein
VERRTPPARRVSPAGRAVDRRGARALIPPAPSRGAFAPRGLSAGGWSAEGRPWVPCAWPVGGRGLLARRSRTEHPPRRTATAQHRGSPHTDKKAATASVAVGASAARCHGVRRVRRVGVGARSLFSSRATRRHKPRANAPHGRCTTTEESGTREARGAWLGGGEQRGEAPQRHPRAPRPRPARPREGREGWRETRMSRGKPTCARVFAAAVFCVWRGVAWGSRLGRVWRGGRDRRGRAAFSPERASFPCGLASLPLFSGGSVIVLAWPQ